MTALTPPIEPMLARATAALPTGPEFVYEPKFDGFRCLAFCDGAVVDLRSRNQRPMSRYFPELVSILSTFTEPAVLDGEILAYREGVPDFASLMSRLHPAASRVARLAVETPCRFVAFDLLAVGSADVRREPFADRRRRLDALIGSDLRSVTLSPITADPLVAANWLTARSPEIDGVVAKRLRDPYGSGRRTMWKVKLERTAECVVAGLRFAMDEPSVSSLLLGCYDDDELRHVGVVSSFTTIRRRELFRDLAPLRIALVDHPWRNGFATEGGPMGRLRGAAARWTPDMPLDWLPLRLERVVEVAYSRVDGFRFRHPAQFRRWRPDRSVRSCTVEQFTVK